MSEILDINKTVVFKTPFDNNTENVIVRTGNITTDNFSLLHSILFATSYEYTCLHKEHKTEYVNELFSKIFDEKLYKLQLNELVSQFYSYIIKPNSNINQANLDLFKEIIDTHKIDTLRVIIELITYEDFKNNIFIHTCNKNDTFHTHIVDKTITYFNSLSILNHVKKEKRTRLENIIKDILDQLLSACEKNMSNIKQNFLDIKNIDSDVLSKLTQLFNINLFIIDYRSRVPIMKEIIDKSLDYVIVINVNTNIYQTLGILHGKKIQRVFNIQNKIINNLITFENNKGGKHYKSSPSDRHKSSPSDRHKSSPSNRHKSSPSNRHKSSPSDRHKSSPSDRHKSSPSDRHKSSPSDRDKSSPSDRDKSSPSDRHKSSPSEILRNLYYH